MQMKTSGRLVPTERLEIKADRPAKLEKIFVEEGQKVRPGDNLVRFADEKVKQRLDFARAEMKEAEAGLAANNFLLVNKEKLIEEGKLIQIMAEGLESKIAYHRATMDRAREEIKLLEEVVNPVTLVTAPFAGQVSKKNVSEGSLLNKGDLVLELSQLNPIKLVFQLPVEFVDFMTRDTPVKVHFATVKGREFDAAIQMMGPEIAENRMMEIKATLSNDDEMLRPGQAAEVAVITDRPIKLLYAPAEAVWEEGGSKYLYRLNGKKVEKVSVDAGEKREGLVSITRGLREGDLVVISDREGLSNGTSVEVQLAEAR